MTTSPSPLPAFSSARCWGALFLLGGALDGGETRRHARVRPSAGRASSDLKPANILLILWLVSAQRFQRFRFPGKLADSPGQIGGTLNYMAPEQQTIFIDPDRAAAIARLDRRADLLSSRCPEGVACPRRRARGRRGAALDGRSGQMPGKYSDRRFPDGASFAKALKGALELYRIGKELPQNNSCGSRGFACQCYGAHRVRSHSSNHGEHGEHSL